ncbi:M16 family metallopeptidase [Saccharothrix sp. NRRL B-16314]|uniref:M16 family metallopeptidase n=1 Tax=Saccharothrix sp. NRRL B-16314 TaxID=1463825 RepID=UPI0009DF312C|nr:pitrilysin family protein [Saccharothrix sp. NRRL B-16314]
MFVVKALDNGVRVALDGSLGVRSVTVCVSLGAGAAHDAPDQSGLSHLVEHLVLEAPCDGDTPLAKWVDSVGGQSNASTSHEAVVFWARVPPEAAVECVRHLDRAVARPRITDELCDSERSVVLQELLAAAADPIDVARESFHGALFAGGPFARPVGGDVENFPELPAEDVLRAHSRTLAAHPVDISLVGPPDLLAESFDVLTGGELARLERTGAPALSDRAVAAPPLPAADPDAEYAYLVAGGPGAGRSTSQWAAAEVLAAAIGGTPGSVLYERLRGELGMGYQLQSFHTAYRDVGSWSVVVGAPPEHVPLVERTVHDCLDAVASGRLAGGHLDAAKRQAVGSVLLDNEDPVALAHLDCAWLPLVGSGEPPVDAVRRLIAGVDHEDVRAAAARVLKGYTHVVAS